MAVPKFPITVAVGLVGILSAEVFSAETSIAGGAGLSYRWDDNINVSPTNEISLDGYLVDLSLAGNYSTERMRIVADMKLDIERYRDSSIDSDDPRVEDPDPEVYDSEGGRLGATFEYDWERHSVSLVGGYSQDTTRNTQFTDTGLGQPAAALGDSVREKFDISTGWNWKFTERQALNTTLSATRVDYDTERFVDYDRSSINFAWSYLWSERLRLQASSYFSHFDNDADIAVESDNIGLQAGFIWEMAEKWQVDVLLGQSWVETEYGQDGLVIIDPETGELEIVRIEDEDSQSTIGSLSVAYREQTYSLIAKVTASVSPSGSGVLREDNKARLTFNWEPIERLRLDIDGLVGQSSTSDARIDSGRDYSEIGLRLGYQFAPEWWLSGRYRHRIQDYEGNKAGKGRGNSLFVTVSYRLPKEIF